MTASRLLALILASSVLALPACEKHEEQHNHEHNKIVVTSPKIKDVVITQQYVCQIRSQCNIEVSTLINGRIEEIHIKEGQAVKKGEVLFKLLPILYQTKLDAESAKVRLAEIKLRNTENLAAGNRPVVSQQDVAMHRAELAEAQAKMGQARAELNFTDVRAQFDGIVDRLLKQQGTSVKEGETLTTLFDNSHMWVYFNVPEARYLEYMGELGQHKEESLIELVLANGTKFSQTGKIGAIEAKFNNETGTVPFRADFPNPDRLLRHGQTGNILIHRTQKNAIVIPQRATFEILDKQYVYVVGDDQVVHQRPITIQHEMEDVFLIKSGLSVDDKIVLEGVRQVHDGEKVGEYESRKPEEALANQKNHAE